MSQFTNTCLPTALWPKLQKLLVVKGCKKHGFSPREAYTPSANARLTYGFNRDDAQSVRQRAEASIKLNRYQMYVSRTTGSAVCVSCLKIDLITFNEVFPYTCLVYPKISRGVSHLGRTREGFLEEAGWS